MQADSDWRIPDPDYDRHPAYGRLFGRPRLADRAIALARLLPHLGAYAAYDLLSRARPRQAAIRAASGSPLLEALSRDGVVEPNLVWKDTVLVRTGETVDILLDVTNVGLWMAHCHIAEHHESGMMFSFNVTDDAGASR